MSDSPELSSVLAGDAVPGDLAQLICCLAEACAGIANAVERGSLSGTLGALEQSNVQGETRWSPLSGAVRSAGRFVEY